LLCRDVAKPKTKIGLFIDEQGATNHETLRTTAPTYHRLPGCTSNGTLENNFVVNSVLKDCGQERTGYSNKR